MANKITKIIVTETTEIHLDGFNAVPGKHTNCFNCPLEKLTVINGKMCYDVFPEIYDGYRCGEIKLERCCAKDERKRTIRFE